MEIKCNYDETNSTLYLYSTQTYDERNADKITINIPNHDVKNLHSFFQRRLLELLLKEKIEELSLNLDNIKSYPFYDEESFQKLVALLGKIIEKTNATIQSCFENLESASVENTASN